MIRSLRLVLVLVVGFFLIAMQSVLFSKLNSYYLSPVLILPIVIYLGVSPVTNLAQGAVVSFLLGFFSDSFCGSSMGIHTFAATAIFLMTKGAGLRLFLRGPFFRIGLVFMMSLVFSGAMLALRAIFESPISTFSMTAKEVFTYLVGAALSTSLICPFLFWLIKKLTAFSISDHEETRVRVR